LRRRLNVTDETARETEKTPDEPKNVELSEEDLKRISGGIRRSVDGEQVEKDHRARIAIR
jgi:hypothetical protein